MWHKALRVSTAIYFYSTYPQVFAQSGGSQLQVQMITSATSSGERAPPCALFWPGACSLREAHLVLASKAAFLATGRRTYAVLPTPLAFCLVMRQEGVRQAVLVNKGAGDQVTCRREFFGAPPDVFEFGSPASEFFARHAFGGGGGLFSGGFGAGFSASGDTHVEAPLTLTLEELNTGGPKRLATNRRIYDAASGSGVRVREEVTINITPGWQEGQRCAAPVFHFAPLTLLCCCLMLAEGPAVPLTLCLPHAPVLFHKRAQGAAVVAPASSSLICAVLCWLCPF